MKKTLAIATVFQNAVDFYASLIEEIFGESVLVKKYSIENGSIQKGISEKIVLTHYNYSIDTIKQYIHEDSEIIIANRTLSKGGYDRIKSLPSGTKAMLVNVNAEMAINTISLLHQLNLRHIHLTPVYPGMKKIPNLTIAITPGESKYVPENVEEIIDIGDRLLDISTVMDIALKLDLYGDVEKERIKLYYNNIVPVAGIERIIGQTQRLEGQLELLLQISDEGIIVIDTEGFIHSINKSAEQLLGYTREDVIGQNISEVFPQINVDQSSDNAQAIEENVIRFHEDDLVLGMHPITKHGEYYGMIINLKSFIDTEKKQHKLRAQLIGKGHIAKYTFDHIIGQSKLIQEAKHIATRMAKSDASIVITGESGTGKELFAQAIHNESMRQNYQFVAINCAALPESLLESELFGYNEGAFTGARKGGKPGLFELSHMGTLFLDEIGEMPLSLQARLLRVLQEREVMRIGGDNIIDVDVRIIAATNRDIKKLVAEGKFRKDLYFRLYVLPLMLPPLRNRKEDIPLLTEELMKDLGASFILSKEVQSIFVQHTWEGNVRELRNYLEYLSNLNKGIIEKNDLPFLQTDLITVPIEEKGPKNLELLTRELGHYGMIGYRILRALDSAFITNEKMGRRSLVQILYQKGIHTTEQEVRTTLNKMAELGYVEIQRGRLGTLITEKGRDTLKMG